MGTNYIAPTWRQPENINKDKLSNYSIDTTGTTGINCGPMADLFGTASVTYNTSYSIWIKPEFDYNTGNYQTFYGNYTTGNNGALLYYHKVDKKWRFFVGDGSGNNFVNSSLITSNEELGKGEWQHHCVVFDTVNNNAYYYINNQQVNSATSLSRKIATNADFYIGKKWDLSSGTFSGLISQGCVFDYALSTSQRTYLYNLNNPLVISGAEPIAYWPLGDNSNPTANAGYPNIVSSADSVFDFAASNEEIDAPGPYADGTQGDLTISAWVKQDSITTAYKPFICTGFTTSMTQPQIAMALRNVSGNRLYLFYNGGGGSNYIYAQNVMTEANKWYHCAFVRSGSTGKLYVDGQEVSTLNSADFSTDPAVTTADSEITLGGWRYSGSNESLNGELSNVCLWKTALTDGVGGQIEELYNNGLPLLELSEIPQDNNLLAWYKLNQSAVLTPGITASPWVVSVATGNPDYSLGDDGAYTLNGEFRCRDTGAYSFSDSFYLTFRTITGAHNNITLTSTGGYLQTDGGIRFEYRIDGGSWVQFQEVDGPSTGSWAFTPPSSVNCSTSYELRAQMHGSAYSGSYISLYDMTISASSGTLLTETFGQTNYTGAYSGSISNPLPAAVSPDHWDVPDNRSAYPQSFSFNNSNINVGDIDNAGALSFSTWISTTSTNASSYQNIAYKRNGSTGWFIQYLYDSGTNGKIKFFIFHTNGVGSGGEVTITNLQSGDWFNIVLTYDGTDAIGALKLYSNKDEVYSNSSTLGGTGIAVNNDNLYLGGNVSSAFFTCKLSNIQLWNTGLSEPNVITLYNNGVPLPTASVEPSSLKAWYKLDNTATFSTNWSIPDASGNGNTGTSSGMTEANLIDENVSVVNGESDTLPGTALVQSDLTRKLPFSNYSVLFNGLDESFNCGPGFQYTDITVSCWLKFDTFTNYDRVYQTGISGGGIGFLLVFLTDEGGNKLNAVWGNPTEESVVSNIDIALDTWYNVLWTRNASEIKMYIDGADVSGGSNVSWSYGSGNDLELGRKPGGGNNFDGDLSNMAIWNSVLTQEEILDVYNNGVPTNLNTSFTPGQPEYWWPMDEDHTYFNGSVLIARDAVGSTDATGDNVIQENIVGNAPSSTANGVGSNLTISSLKGDIQNSKNNSYSINMADYADGVTNPADSGRSTNVP